MSRRHRPPRSALTILPWMLLAAAVSTAGSPDPAAPPPDRERVRRLPEAPAAPDRLPDGLVPPERRATPGPRGGRVVPPDDGRADRPRPVEDDRILGWARESGRWAAIALFEARGRLEVVRVAFPHGIVTAVESPLVGEHDEEDGRRDGLLDPRAYDAGAALAAEEAARLARQDARARAETLFADLTLEPGSEPPPPAPGWRPHVAPSRGPSLEETVRSWPPESLPDGLDPAAALLRRWDDDPWLLFLRPAPAAIDAWWTDPDRGFPLWLDRDEHRRRFEALPDDGARRAFRQAFDAGFRDALQDEVAPRTRDAWSDGFAIGWRYGAWIVCEHRYAVGWYDGWSTAVADAAAATFPHEWDRAWRRAFDAELARWWRSPQPRIVALELADGDDDGVFEPGERVVATVEVVNLGGARGAPLLGIDGDVLTGGQEIHVELPARTARTAVFELEIRRSAPLRRRSQVHASLDEVVASRPLWVSRPLELDGGWRAAAVDPVGGTATVVATVVNASRQPVSATATFEVEDAAGLARFADLGILAPGAEAEALFELDGIHGLDLLAGTVHGTVVVRGDGLEHDRRSGRLPDLAADLESRGLERYLEATARRPDPSADEVALLCSLVRRRLELDWRRAAAARGNPYREDAEGGGRRTALGDLVRLAERVGPDAASPEVLHAVAGEARSLQDELPGVHPRLRRWYRQLSLRLP